MFASDGGNFMLRAYPAVFHPEEKGGYYIEFPDLEDTFTGINENDVAFGVSMAEEVLGLMLADRVESGQDLPTPTDISKLKAPEGGLVTLVKVDLQQFFKDMTPVKKTLTIPTWANELGLRQGINFSHLLTTAIANVSTSTRDL